MESRKRRKQGRNRYIQLDTNKHILLKAILQSLVCLCKHTSSFVHIVLWLVRSREMMGLEVIQQLTGRNTDWTSDHLSQDSVGLVFQLVIFLPVLCSPLIDCSVFNLFAPLPQQCNKTVSERVYVTFKTQENGSRLRRISASKLELKIRNLPYSSV